MSVEMQEAEFAVQSAQQRTLPPPTPSARSNGVCHGTQITWPFADVINRVCVPLLQRELCVMKCEAARVLKSKITALLRIPVSSYRMSSNVVQFEAVRGA